jgi:hypothetical protein
MDDSHNASPSFPRVHLAPPGAARVHQLQHMFQVAVACPNRDQPRQVPPRRGKSDQRTASGQHVVIWSDIQHLAASGNVCQEGGIAGYLEPWSGPPEGPQTICRFADVTLLGICSNKPKFVHSFQNGLIRRIRPATGRVFETTSISVI